jgi:hypothetical protein
MLCSAAFTGRSHAATSQDTLVLIGPVESVDSTNSIATVLGQKVQFGKLTKPQLGSSVAVFGRVQQDGSIIAHSMRTSKLYVAGADTVLLTGSVRAVDSPVAHLTVGGVQVDYSAAMAASFLTPRSGNSIQLIGTQPAPGGVVIAYQIQIATSDGIIGGGLKSDGIIGGGLTQNGIIGGGKVSTDGIIGGGKVSADGIIGGGR